ncbi:MAG: translation initiation factor IF-2 N-terminal domain-containing protein [Candidatus Melainabacteria bacterium]|nr:MAG: translation initiation factor IF-2 N-terminal domain-containing protein [Candidatus Melainabacteria bacterium]
MQEMISLEKAMAQKHKKKVHEENENEVEVKQVVIDSSISVGDLAKKIQKTPAEIVRYLMMNGVLATVNQIIDAKMAKKVAESFDIEVLDEDLDAYIQEELKKEEKSIS